MVKIMAYYAILNILLSITPTIRIAATTSAFYIFGDSTVDVGNNNYLPTAIDKANFPHYGIDYPHSIPTGRFTNGLLAIDYMARALGYLKSPAPFLSINNEVIQILRGVNFASAGSGILNTTGTNEISFDEQIENFATAVGKLRSKIGKHATAHHLSKSLIYISTGNNDLFALYSSLQPQTSSQKDQIVVTLINKFRDQLKSLYKVGVRKFAVTGTGLVGNIPVLRLSNPEHDPNEDLNDLSYRFKIATNALLEDLSIEHDDFYFSFGDAYEFGLQVFSNPTSFGLVDVKSACCGAGELNAEEMCAPNTTYCANRDQYHYWDRIHPSQAVYKVIAEKLMFGSAPLVNPINIHQLISEAKIINKAEATSFI